jgi:hypothetical protein
MKVVTAIRPCRLLLQGAPCPFLRRLSHCQMTAGCSHGMLVRLPHYHHGRLAVFVVVAMLRQFQDAVRIVIIIRRRLHHHGWTRRGKGSRENDAMVFVVVVDGGNAHGRNVGVVDLMVSMIAHNDDVHVRACTSMLG